MLGHLVKFLAELLKESKRLFQLVLLFSGGQELSEPIELEHKHSAVTNQLHKGLFVRHRLQSLDRHDLARNFLVFLALDRQDNMAVKLYPFVHFLLVVRD